MSGFSTHEFPACPNRGVSIPRRAFTLVELLIIVAIIAILATIAIPNFQQAWTRSKVSRVRADMRILAGALESYHLDNNGYVQPTGNGIPTRLWRLSTPVAYLTHPRMPDEFDDTRQGRSIRHEIEYWGCNDQRTALSSTADGEMIESRFGGGEPRVLWFFLRSTGPDQDVNANGAGYLTWLDPAEMNRFLYDPTNGTVSFGDLFRTGGCVADNFQPSAALVAASQ